MNNDLISRQLDELRAEYEQAKRQLNGLERSIEKLEKHASYIVQTGDFLKKPLRVSNEAWRRRASETIKDLMKTDKNSYPTFNSVLVPIYIKLRNVYGVVLDQLRKDFRYKYDMLRYPSAFEAISDDDTIRDIFDSLLIGMFPDDYFDDEVLSIIERGGALDCQKKPEELIMKILVPLAIKLDDDSFGYSRTFDMVCDNMDCAWHNLQTRFMKKNGLNELPSTLTIIVSNDNVLRKFKKTVRVMLEKYTI